MKRYHAVKVDEQSYRGFNVWVCHLDGPQVKYVVSYSDGKGDVNSVWELFDSADDAMTAAKKGVDLEVR